MTGRSKGKNPSKGNVKRKTENRNEKNPNPKAVVYSPVRNSQEMRKVSQEEHGIDSGKTAVKPQNLIILLEQSYRRYKVTIQILLRMQRDTQS